MTSRHKNSSHGRFSKKQKKASRTMMSMRRGFKPDRHSSSSMPEMAKAGLVASILPFLLGRGRGG